MRIVWAAVLFVSLASGVAAQPSPDAEGDGGGADIVSVLGVLAQNATVEVRFASPQEVDGRALRGVLLYGEPGAAEPVEWYQFTVADETHVFAAHGTPRDVEVVAVSWNGSLARLEFQRSEPAAASCVFAVVESGVLGDGGFEVLDVAPRGFTSMDSAWPVQSCPSREASLEGDSSTEAKGSPGLGLGLLVALGVALRFRRR